MTARELRLLAAKAVVEAAGGAVGGGVGPDACTASLRDAHSGDAALEALAALGFTVEPWSYLSPAEFAARPVHVVRVPAAPR